MTDLLPDAHYLVLASRLLPDRDGGFTISVLRRALDMAEAGAGPLLLTIDPGESEDHDSDRIEWVRRGLLSEPDALRNLFDDARADPAWLRAAAVSAPIPEAEWPYRPITDASGATVLELPVVSGDPAWHLTEAPVRIWTDGEPTGWLPGYAGLYRAWINALAARADKPVVLVCEARQVGEALVAPGEPVLDPRVRIVHTTHACHVLAPFAWDSPMDAAWERWFTVADRFDAVLWLTPSQQRDVERRVGRVIRSFVVPHPAPQPEDVGATPVIGRIVMLNSLIPRKRVDHAIRALAALRATRREAHLHVYGDGAQRAELEQLAADLGVADAVVFQGHAPDTSRAWAEADVFVLASTNEGQPLVVLEALGVGVPVVSYDMPYGPRDTLALGGGRLVGDGDVDALASTLAEVIGDRALRERLSHEGRAAAAEMDAAASMRAMGEAVRAAIEEPAQRAGR
ncbi:glycosyltransferase [Microbacterium sp. BK668]|uniref:glycosyltransferase n=1 Tax=Microbacterium sp. BK668 TaxID=2512118 RepID=UPI0010E1ECD7|nr:glycosyltransferase [Microbacterium sp. BK668]TDN87500.1 poly(glycerol-phosphate) alpha-glucosyltransferase [Microbacterium sp. BK668]